MIFIIKAQGPGPCWAEIKRVGDSMNDPRDQRSRMNLNKEQDTAYERAYQFAKAGKEDEALAEIKPHFQIAWIEHPK